MLAPLFLSLTQIFIWGVVVQANVSFGNEYLTTGVLLVAIIFKVWTVIEVWEYAIGHSAIDGEQGVEGE